MDPRHKKRIKTVQNLFVLTFKNVGNNLPYPEDEMTKAIQKSLNLVDQHIQKYAPKFPINKIAKIDLSILRLSTYELLIKKEEPAKVIIDEAVEIAHEFGGDKSYAFVNAILGKIYNENKKGSEYPA